VRRLIHAADPGIEETIKRTTRAIIANNRAGGWRKLTNP
jgi:hypothetical protein